MPNATEQVQQALDGVGEEIADAILADIRDHISTECPAFLQRGGVWMGGGHSPPGGDPYKETGALMEGLEAEVTNTPKEVRITIRSFRNGSGQVPMELNGLSPSNVPARPYMFHARERAVNEIIPAILTARLTGTSATMRRSGGG